MIRALTYGYIYIYRTYFHIPDTTITNTTYRHVALCMHMYINVYTCCIPFRSIPKRELSRKKHSVRSRKTTIPTNRKLGSRQPGFGAPSPALASLSRGLGSLSLGWVTTRPCLGSDPSLGLASPSLCWGARPSLGLCSPSLGLGSVSLDLVFLA